MRKLLAGAVLWSAACGPSPRDTSATDAAPQADAAAPQDGTVVTDTSRVYAHSGGTLYRLNNATLVATPIGSMTGLDGNLLDLAVDQDDNIVGVTFNKLYTLNATTGVATLKGNLAASAENLTSLSYVPHLDPAMPDVLVSANDEGKVFEINTVTGTATLKGNYGTAPGGALIVSSGDLFGVRGVGVFATVNVGTDTQDYLARVDPANGWKATVIGSGTGHDKIFGLGYWGGKIYGFVDNGFDVGGGKMIQIDATTGKGTVLTSANIRWFGAGVATDAPIFE
ncbi:MAG: hypothetical protein M3680_06420 [Myxococcota bacterium]|nr:hypothetical protein [Myxococcota bacterium]